MNSVPVPRPAYSARRGSRGKPWIPVVTRIAVAAIVGLLLGLEIYEPQPRVLKAMIGIAVLYAGWKFPIPVSLAAFLLLFPYPFGIAYGSSNTIFIFLITAMWLGQMVLGSERPVGRTMLDIPILYLMGAYLLSFSEVENSRALAGGLLNFSTIVASVFTYYLIVHTVRDEARLKRTVNIIVIMIFSAFAVAFYELLFPGRPLVKGWIAAGGAFYSHSVREGLRVGGPFTDFELFAEFCAMVFPLMLFHLFRAQGLMRRIGWAGVVVANMFVLLATVTRGGTIALLAGMFYFFVIARKRMNFKQVTVALAITAFVVVGIEFYLTHFTVSGSIFRRLMETKIVSGMPDTRTFWPKIIARIEERPWLGHGPFYEFGEYGREKLRRFMWPHNGYLFLLHTVGLVGTSAFLWILWRLWSNTRKRAAAVFTDASYARSLLLVWHLMITIFMIDQLKVEFLRNPSYQFWPWIVFGMSVATLNVIREREPVQTVTRIEKIRQWFAGRRRRSGRNPALNVPVLPRLPRA